MKKYPVSSAGLLIMIAAAVVGFQPSLPSLLLMFATTIFGGYMIKKNAGQETYDGFVKLFGLMCAGANFLAGGMLMFATKLPYIDRMSGAFLSFMIGIVIVTLIKNNTKVDDTDNGSN